MAFVSCEKEVSSNAEEAPVTHTATITLSKIDDTRTAIGTEGAADVSYVWTEGDNAYISVYENDVKGTITDYAFSPDYKTVTLEVGFTGDEAASYSYRAVYAKHLSGSGNPEFQAEQAPSTTSFDPLADVLISYPAADVTNVTDRADLIDFTMGRVVSVNKMTLTGLAEGEKVSKVEFTLDKSFVGGNYVINTKNSIPSGKKLTVNYATPVVVGAAGTLPVYFTCAPVESAAISSVVVTTDLNVYTKSSTLDPNPFAGKTISFAVGEFKKFNMALSGFGAAISTGTAYNLVENQDDLYVGATYLIVANDGTDYYALGGQNNNNRAAVSVTEDSGVITIDNTIAAKPLVVESVSGGYLLKDKETNNYLYANSTSSNQMRSTSDAGEEKAVWTITITGGVAHIVNVGNTSHGTMRFNPNSGNPLFAAYQSTATVGTGDLALYVDPTTVVPDTRVEAGLAWSASSATATIEDGDVVTFTAPTLTLGNASDVTYESTTPAVATVSAAGVVTVLAGGETTIKAIFAGDANYKPATAEYTLTVTDNRTPAATTVSDVTAAGSYTIDNLTVMAVSGRNVIAADATGAILIYAASGHGFVANDVINVDGTVKAYNGIWEFDQPTITKTTTTTAVYPTPVEYDDTKMTAYASAPVVEYGVATGIASSSDRSLTVAGGKVLNVYGDLSSVDGQNAVITGYAFGYYNSKVNFMLVGTPTVDTTTPSLSVSPSALNWAAAETDSKTVTVTINGSASGYSVSPTTDANWNIADNGSGTITVSPKAANTSTEAAKTLTLTITHNDDGTLSEQVTCTQAKASSGGTQTYVDELTQTWTGVTGTNYTSWSNKSGSASTAVYAGQSAGGNSSIQLRSNNSNSGVVTTTSGGKVKKIKVTWNSNTSNGRTLNVYGKNTAYTAATELYNSSNQGTSLGTIVCGTSTEITVTGDYEYIGFRSNSGAMYLDKVEITWEN